MEKEGLGRHSEEALAAMLANCKEGGNNELIGRIIDERYIRDSTVNDV